MATQKVPPITPPARRGRRRPVTDVAAAAAPPGGGFVAAADERQVVSLAGLTRKAGLYLSEDDLRRIRDAYRFIDAAHIGQFRSSGAP